MKEFFILLLDPRKPLKHSIVRLLLGARAFRKLLPEKGVDPVELRRDGRSSEPHVGILGIPLGIGFLDLFRHLGIVIFELLDDASDTFDGVVDETLFELLHGGVQALHGLLLGLDRLDELCSLPHETLRLTRDLDLGIPEIISDFDQSEFGLQQGLHNEKFIDVSVRRAGMPLVLHEWAEAIEYRSNLLVFPCRH